MTDNEYVMSDENISEMEMVEIEDMNMSNKTFANFSKTNSNVTVCKGGSTIKVPYVIKLNKNIGLILF